MEGKIVHDLRAVAWALGLGMLLGLAGPMAATSAAHLGTIESVLSGGDPHQALPRATVNVYVDSSPSGFEIQVNRIPVSTPYVFPCEEGASYLVNATSPRLRYLRTDGTGDNYYFASWSDAGPQEHWIDCRTGSSLVATYDLVPKPDFAMWIFSSRVEFRSTSPLNLEVTVVGVNGYDGSEVVLTVLGAVPGMSLVPKRDRGVPGFDGSFTLTVSPPLAAGLYPMTIVGRNGTATRAIPLLIDKVHGIQIQADAGSIEVETGKTAVVGLYVNLTGDIETGVILEAFILPKGVTAIFTESGFLSSTKSHLVFNVGWDAAAGTYPINVTAIGDIMADSTIVELRITPSVVPALYGLAVIGVVTITLSWYFIRRRNRRIRKLPPSS
jgi:hypothetical protein